MIFLILCTKLTFPAKFSDSVFYLILSISGFLKNSFSPNMARFGTILCSHYYTYLYQFPRAAITKQTGSYCQFLRLEIQNKGVSKVMFFLKAPREETFLPLPRFWWFPEILGVSWFLDASFQCLPPSTHDVLPVCLCSNFPLFIRTSFF